METNLTRVVHIDIAKGIVIFLMVIGHTSIPEIASKWIWSFHMPFFFFISGVLFNYHKYGEWGAFAKSRIRQLVIPYILMSITVFIALYPLGNIQLDELLFGWKGYPLWFVPVLLMAETLGLCVIKLKDIKIISSIAAALLVVAYVLWMVHWHCAYKVESVPLACFFFLMGFLLKDSVRKLRVNIWILAIIAILHFVLAQILPKLDMCFYNFGSWANPINSILGIVMILAVSRLLESVSYNNILRKFFIWAGKNTLLIMGFASMVIMLINALLEFTTIPKVITSPAKHIVLWIVLYMLTIMINKFIPEMAGKKRI